MCDMSWRRSEVGLKAGQHFQQFFNNGSLSYEGGGGKFQCETLTMVTVLTR